MTRLGRSIMLVSVLALGAVVAAPFVRGDRFREPLSRSLQATLGRSVTMEQVRFTLWRGPGFTATNVVVGDQPEFGVEPLATVPEIQVRLSLLSLLQGRVEARELRLDGPSLNLVRNAAGRWNLQGETHPHPAAASSEPLPPRRLPDLVIRDGRLNFKLGDEKGVFYLSKVDLDLQVASTADGLRAEFQLFGKPARTDRSEVGFGGFSAEGRWSSNAPDGGRLEMDARLERSSLADLLTLVQGRAQDLRGYLVSRAHVQGPLSSLRVQGSVQSDELQRWEVVTPWSGAGGVKYSGELRLNQGVLHLATDPPPGPKEAPFTVALAAETLMSYPRWTLVTTLNNAPMREAVPIARQLGVDLRDPLPTEGRLSGTVSLKSDAGLDGSLQLRDVVWPVGELGTMHAADVPLRFSGQEITLEKAAFTDSEGNSADLAMHYHWPAPGFDITLSGKKLALASVLSLAERIPVARGRLGLHSFSGGLFSGDVTLTQAADESVQWSANGSLTNTSFLADGLAHPVHLKSATVRTLGERVDLDGIRFAVGRLAGTATASFDPARKEPLRLKIALADITATQLQEELRPTLKSDASLLERTLFRRRPERWLQERNLEATLEATSLTVGDLIFDAPRVSVAWRGPLVNLRLLDGRWNKGKATGSATIKLQQSEPAYDFQFNVADAISFNGVTTVSIQGESSGLGDASVSNLKASGFWQAQSWQLLPEGPIRKVEGTFDFAGGKLAPRLRFENVQFFLGSDLWKGAGGLEQNNRLMFEFNSGGKQWRVSGSLFPLQLSSGG